MLEVIPSKFRIFFMKKYKWKGAFVAALEYSSNVTSTVVGKPNKEFFLASIEDLDVKPEECIMIGDVCISCFIMNF